MTQGTKPPLPTRIRTYARDLRQHQTDAERELWYHLRGGRLNGRKFRRQHPIPPYIVDFYCESLKLVVEVDGSQHGDEADLERTRFLERQGLRVLRFWDNEVLGQRDAVLEVLLGFAEGREL